MRKMDTDKHHNVTNRRRFLQRFSSLCIAGMLNIIHFPLVLANSLANSLQHITGKIIKRGDPHYGPWWASMSWYIFKPKRYPDLIIQAMDEQDVINAINYARQQGLKVAVRSTGHNPGRAVLRDGGILLDLSRLRSV